jgi:hypothetical protein
MAYGGIMLTSCREPSPPVQAPPRADRRRRWRVRQRRLQRQDGPLALRGVRPAGTPFPDRPVPPAGRTGRRKRHDRGGQGNHQTDGLPGRGRTMTLASSVEPPTLRPDPPRKLSQGKQPRSGRMRLGYHPPGLQCLERATPGQVLLPVLQGWPTGKWVKLGKGILAMINKVGYNRTPRLNTQPAGNEQQNK